MDIRKKSFRVRVVRQLRLPRDVVDALSLENSKVFQPGPSSEQPDLAVHCRGIELDDL